MVNHQKQPFLKATCYTAFHNGHAMIDVRQLRPCIFKRLTENPFCDIGKYKIFIFSGWVHPITPFQIGASAPRMKGSLLRV